MRFLAVREPTVSGSNRRGNRLIRGLLSAGAYALPPRAYAPPPYYLPRDAPAQPELRVAASAHAGALQEPVGGPGARPVVRADAHDAAPRLDPVARDYRRRAVRAGGHDRRPCDRLRGAAGGDDCGLQRGVEARRGIVPM